MLQDELVRPRGVRAQTHRQPACIDQGGDGGGALVERDMHEIGADPGCGRDLSSDLARHLVSHLSSDRATQEAERGVGLDRHRFEGELQLTRTGSLGWTVRVLPTHERLSSLAELGLVSNA